MSEPRLVEVTEGTFTAVLPWIYAIPAPELLAVMTEPDQLRQYAMSLDLFRERLAPDKLPELDLLDLFEQGNLINEWIAKSAQLKDGTE